MAETNLKKGSEFLPETGVGYLREVHSGERNPKAQDRLLVYVMRKHSQHIR